MSAPGQYLPNPEDRALLLALKPSLSPQEVLELKRCLKMIDWDEFASIVNLTGLVGWVHSRLRQSQVEIPVRITNLWMAWQLAVERDNQLRIDQAKKILSAAERKGLPLVPIKGIALYLSNSIQDLSLRSTCDVDLVTMPEHITSVEAILLEQGYIASQDQESFIRHHHHRVYFKPGAADTTTIELHWTFLYKTFGKREYDQILMDRTFTTPEGSRFLEPHDFLLSLLLHLAQHRFRGQLKWVQDIAIAGSHPSIDLKILRNRAKKFGVLSAVDYGLWLTANLLKAQNLEKTSWRIRTLAKVNPPLKMLREPAEPEAWQRPIIDILLHDKIHNGMLRALFRTTKVLEDKYSLRLPTWMTLNKE